MQKVNRLASKWRAIRKRIGEEYDKVQEEKAYLDSLKKDANRGVPGRG